VNAQFRRKIRRALAWSSAGLGVLVAIVLMAAILFVQGPRLASIVNGVLPAMKGSLHFGSIRWKPRLLVDLLTDRATPMVVEGLLIKDPEGTVVLDVPRLEVSVRLKTLISGGGIILADLKVGPNSVWSFSKMAKLPGIGFLSAFDPKKPSPPTPPRPPGAPKEKPFVFQIVNAELDGFRAIFDFPGVWGLDLRDIHASASVLVDGEGFVGWDVTNLEARQGGYLKVMTETLPFDAVYVTRVATTHEWADDIFLDLRLAKTGRSALVGKGFFTGIYGANSVGGIKIHAEFEHAVDALTAVAKPHNIAGLRLSGDSAKVVGDLWDPYDTLKIKAAISGLDVAYDAYAVEHLALRAGILFATSAPTMTISVDELSFASPTGGTFSTALTMAGDDIAAKLDFEHFDTAGYVPASLKKLAAGKMQGHFSVAATIGEKKSAKLKDLDLRYDRAFRQNAIPSTVRITGQAQASTESASTAGLHVAIPGATADVRGKVELGKKLIDVGLRVAASDLPAVLSTMNVGPLAKNAEVAVDVTGSMDRPEATGHIKVSGIGGGTSGIPPVDEFATSFRLHDGSVFVDSLRAGVAGGSIEGGGSAKLFEATVAHMLAAPVLDFRLDGKRLSLRELISSGVVSGQVSFGLTASGTTRKPKAHFQVPSGTTVEVMGQPWLLEGVDIEVDKEMLVVKLCHIAAKAGGDVRIEGRVNLAKRPLAIDWTIRISDLPIPTLLATAKVDGPVSGMLSIDLHVRGTVERPTVEGSIVLGNVHAFDLDLGDAKLALAPTSDGGVSVAGNLFKLLDVDASARYDGKGAHAKALIAFNDLHAETLLPALNEQGIASSLSGRISLAIEPNTLPAIDVRITGLEASVTRSVERNDGTTTKEKVWIKNAGDLHIVTDTEKVVVDPATLATGGGDFTLSAEVHPIKDGKGHVLDQAVTADFGGQLDLDFLQPLLAGSFSSLGGGIGLEVHVRGSVKKPDLNGGIGIARPLHAQARGFGQTLYVPSGALRLTSSAVELSNLAVTISDATMKLGGKVNLGPGFTPESFAVSADGEVSAKLLETLVPSAFSDVSGKASIAASISGTPNDPKISAHINLGEIQMRMRGISSHIAVQSGSVDLSSHEFLLHNVRVRLDDEGELLIGAEGVRPGRVHFKSLRPEFVWDSIDFPLAGNRLAYHDQGIEVDDLALATELKGNPEEGLAFAGDIRLVSGRYLQDFNVRNLVISPRINESDSKPFWRGEPMLENLALNLRVRTEGDGFIVQNNLAPEIHIAIDLGIGGTLASPAISGEIRPTDGRFHIIGLRNEFELSPNVNHVTFVPTKSISAGDTPELNLEAQNTVPDAAGANHVVIMKISGPINQATIDLSTQDGMDRNQTLLLLLSGRTTDDLSGNGGQIFGMNRQSGLDMIGQLSRDTVSNLVEPYIDDTLQMLTGRKWNLRPAVGADGFEVTVRAQTIREFNLELSYWQGFENQKRYGATSVQWIRDYLTLNASVERLTYTLQQGLPVQTTTGKLELTLEYPIRWPNP
jgi:hypothetical protein